MWENLLFDLLQIGLTVSAVALIPIVLRRVLKKRYPARAMCLVWALLAVRLLIPVQLTLPEPPVQVTPHTYYLLHEVALPQQNETTLDPLDNHWLDKRQAAALGEQDTASITTLHVGPMVAWIWLAGAMGFAAWQAVMYLLFRRRLRKNARVMKNEFLNAVFMREKQALGISRDIPLLVSGAADCPMLAGLISPTLYLPGEALLREDAAFIFRHELIHYRHGDLWIKLLLVLARSMQWFNPLIHLMARFACEDIEMACDDAVAKNLDSAERRAYGETILRSAIDKAKRRSLVSCFTGDKKTLMRRFEGLFDTRVKKRGAALVVAAAVLVGTLGCGFSIREKTESLTDAELVELGRQWMSGSYRDAEPWYRLLTDDLAKQLYDKQVEYGKQVGELGGAIPGEPLWRIGASNPHVERFTVFPDEITQQVILVTEWGGTDSVLTRIAERLHFRQQNGTWKVDKVEGNPYINDTPFMQKANSLEAFCTLYQNDLGLPDHAPGSSGQHIWDEPPEAMRDPVQAAVAILQLDGGEGSLIRMWDATNDGTNDLAEVRYAFADNSVVCLTMAPVLATSSNGDKKVWLSQDWTTEKGENSRTAADLTRQFARSAYHKSVWPLYTVQSKEQRQKLVNYQLRLSADATPDKKEVWYTKLGGSSPAFRDYVIVSTDDPKACIAVLQSYGGGSSDGRVAYRVTTGQENGRSVITAIENISDLEYTQSDKFNLYYGTGLGWPLLEYALNIRAGDAGCYNGPDLSTLRQPDTALQSTTYTNLEWYSQFHGETLILSQNESDAVVRLTFDDSSGSVDVHMHKDGDYWLPVGLNS
ncbi:M56 family metallopeptidase [Agathobaculum sp. NTUH-O15-33]|uniref:M56 family metallopeptidase n=1 Tax=Agathobaculum sp. NTUH-O15-33 TaxID=3079302 RepID=UPI002958C374|nr:M56 family metallopeptidase [Agathobaculum sp. NTUH-O15-33]WNX83650.1 M56 family metallopeptidase [Agathobaculum sp. NTUH-O15-33]